MLRPNQGGIELAAILSWDVTFRQRMIHSIRQGPEQGATKTSVLNLLGLSIGLLGHPAIVSRFSPQQATFVIATVAQRRRDSAARSNVIQPKAERMVANLLSIAGPVFAAAETVV